MKINNFYQENRLFVEKLCSVHQIIDELAKQIIIEQLSNSFNKNFRPPSKRNRDYRETKLDVKKIIEQFSLENRNNISEN